MNIENKTNFYKIISDEGKFLTQVNLENEQDRIFSVSVLTSFPDKWTEWTLSQKEEWENEYLDEDNDTI